MQDKRTPIVQGDLYDFSGSDSEPTSGWLSQKRKNGQAFLPAISYRGFFPSEASMSVLADEQMLMMLASSLQVVGSQTTLPLVNPPTSRIAPPWGKGDPPISVTGVLPKPLGKTRAGRNMWQHTCVGCIYAPYKVTPNIFQFYFDFMDIFHHPPMHPLFRNIYEFYLIFYYFIWFSTILFHLLLSTIITPTWGDTFHFDSVWRQIC